MLYLAFTLLSLTVLEPSLRFTHVRAMTPGVRTLVARGVSRSPTLRTIVARLERSDVVVYVHEERAARGSRVDGSLTFLSSAGGYRYVQVRIVLRAPESRNLATLAHELHHAVEIAAQPSIVDQRTMAAAYRQIGQPNPVSNHSTNVFDTLAEVTVGNRVRYELMN